MGMAMLWSKLDTIRRDTVARTTPWIRRDAGDCKMMVNATPSTRRGPVGSGDTCFGGRCTRIGTTPIKRSLLLCENVREELNTADSAR